MHTAVEEQRNGVFWCCVQRPIGHQFTLVHFVKRPPSLVAQTDSVGVNLPWKVIVVEELVET
jgi:hypothetical protein